MLVVQILWHLAQVQSHPRALQCANAGTVLGLVSNTFLFVNLETNVCLIYGLVVMLELLMDEGS